MFVEEIGNRDTTVVTAIMWLNFMIDTAVISGMGKAFTEVPREQ